MIVPPPVGCSLLALLPAPGASLRCLERPCSPAPPSARRLGPALALEGRDGCEHRAPSRRPCSPLALRPPALRVAPMLAIGAGGRGRAGGASCRLPAPGRHPLL